MKTLMAFLISTTTSFAFAQAVNINIQNNEKPDAAPQQMVKPLATSSMSEVATTTNDNGSANSLRKKRMAMEAETEQKTLEMLERDRMEREKIRAKVLFGQALNTDSSTVSNH